MLCRWIFVIEKNYFCLIDFKNHFLDRRTVLTNYFFLDSSPPFGGSE
jgi:hypothetical protein